MLGIDKLQQAITDLAGDQQRQFEVLRGAIIETRSFLALLSADVSRRLDKLESAEQQQHDMLAILHDFEEAHAKYTEQSINGFPQRDRVACSCNLCVAARRLL